MLHSLPLKHAIQVDGELSAERCVLPINAPRRGRAPMFEPDNREFRPRERKGKPVSPSVQAIFYGLGTAFGCWLAFGFAWKGW